MIGFALLALVCLVPGLIGYLGVWRSWTGRQHDRPTLFGVFWTGIGFALAAVSEALPPPASGALLTAALAVVVLGGVFAFLIPPPLTPRWYRAQLRR